jgi:Fic family protein
VPANFSWKAVTGVPAINGDVSALLATIDDLRRVWEQTLSLATSAEVGQARKRSLRRHAIETGIIERLYDLDWGVTEALVAEGLTLQAAEQEGGVTEDTLAVIRDQYEALEYLADACHGDFTLTVHFIRQLHDLITRHQLTYEARDQFGRVVNKALQHGAWKTDSNRVRRDDGTVVEFAPPAQVQPAMEALLRSYEESAGVHPLVRAAWLHHQFITIHPFADGNGRVGRALTLLVLLQARYAPLVVDRRQRVEYIEALEDANEGDLRPLVRMFARLEGVALRSELIRPTEDVPAGSSAVDVTRASVERLRTLQRNRSQDQQDKTVALAAAIHGRLGAYLREVSVPFREEFRTVDPAADVAVYQAVPGDERAGWWRAQLIRAANAVDFYSNLHDGCWWSQLRLTAFRQTLRYVVAVQKAGRGDTGVLVVTVFAESLDTAGDSDQTRPTALLQTTPHDSVTLVYTDDAELRWPEVHELADRTLAAAITRFSGGLG